MLEETSLRTSAKWVPHSTFAADLVLTGEKDAPEAGRAVHNEQATGDQTV